MKGSPTSLWMSAAHRAMGWWRGQVMAEAGRQKGRLLRVALPKLPKRKPRRPLQG
ncbi:hypothetical protein [Roseomonas sp. BN140053]|uniref:hypothetical protein n=1 Tax=Roseomonas sp. BN140053 TaxID=3391898 RepID=UPI0039E9970C